MYIKQHYLGCLSHASYFIGDEKTKEACVVDPQRDVDGYIQEAKERGFEIKRVFLTHFHADFVAGHLELRERTGAEIYLGVRGDAEYAHEPMREGESVTFGDVKLAFLETPGHTPEGVCILVYDLARDASEPHGVLTGDTLFIGDVGRPDLMASKGVSAEELAGMMYDSLHEKLLLLPDETLVYPAHGAGSACGKNMSSETFAKLGDQKRVNWALQPMDKAEFVKKLTSDQRAAPTYFAYDAELNRRERKTLGESLRNSMKALPLSALSALPDAIVLDVRDPDEYAAGHLRGSINIALGGRYAEWAGTLLDRSKPIVLLAPAGREAEAAMRLGRIGFDQVAGFLDGGPAAVAAADPGLVRSSERIEAPAARAEIEGEAVLFVLDVRTRAEHEQGHIEGSLNLPLDGLEAELERVPRDRRILVHCRSGYRSSIAASLLERHGIEDTADLLGGYLAWEEELEASGT
jgi:rhodanese-related sulfurtransferase/glyoxylase-like metal-dependent hydrolase (beta-lactamase superfamily II)